jgi:HD domain
MPTAQQLPQKQAPHDGSYLDELLKNLVRATQRVNTLAENFANQVEAKFPGHNFGLGKLNHCRAMRDEAPKFSKAIGLSNSETALLEFICLCHDIGRHEEVIKGLLKNRELRHGYDSVRLLEENDILQGLALAEQTVIKDAIRWHSQKDVELDKASLGYKLCYVLRDLDKLEIFSNTAQLLGAAGLTTQLEMHYYSIDEKNSLEIAKEAEFKSSLALVVPYLLDQKALPLESNFDSAIARKVALHAGNFINSPVIEDGAIEKFLGRQSLPLSLIYRSYPTYMLFTIAMSFDLHYPSNLKLVVQDKLLEPTWEFLKKRIPDNLYTKLRNSWDSYCQEKIQ